MGVLTDIRTGKSEGAGLGGYALVFWLCVGATAGGGFGYHLAGQRLGLVFLMAGATIGSCVGFYAAFAGTHLAGILTLPGLLVLAIGIMVGTV
jgi:hypothetical protein